MMFHLTSTQRGGRRSWPAERKTMNIRNIRGIVAFAVLAVSSVSAFAQDIVHTAERAGSFKTLLAAVKAAGLVSVLKSEGPFTVFAPTDEAFAKLGKTVDDLLKPENKSTLQAILKYHVLPNEVLAARVTRLRDGSQVKTVQGETIRIQTRNGIKINNANLLKTDVLADNGVIHVIDAVLLPPSIVNASKKHKNNQEASASTCNGGK